MKYRGRVIKGPNKKVVPILRDPEPIYFIVQGVTDLEPFHKLCPQPVPPKKRVPGGRMVENVEDPRFKTALNQWATKRMAWMAITSLRATPELEWESVQYDNPETWEGWQEELKQCDFADLEIASILNAILEVNGLSERLVEEARQTFLLRESPDSDEFSLPDGQKNMLSGEPANGQASDSQELRIAPTSTS